MSGGTVNGTIVGQGGGNTYTFDGGVVNGSLFAGSGNDTVTIAGNAVINASPGQSDAIGLDTGDDAFTMTGGAINGDVSGNAGNDTFSDFRAARLTATHLATMAPTTITISGGSIAGDVDAETVVLTGGTIGGNITGITETRWS